MARIAPRDNLLRARQSGHRGNRFLNLVDYNLCRRAEFSARVCFRSRCKSGLSKGRGSVELSGQWLRYVAAALRDLPTGGAWFGSQTFDVELSTARNRAFSSQSYVGAASLAPPSHKAVLRTRPAQAAGLFLNKKAQPLVNIGFALGAEGGNRTPDLLITSELLCP